MVEKLPDSITSWVISAFAVRRDTAVAFTAQPFQVGPHAVFLSVLRGGGRRERWGRWGGGGGWHGGCQRGEGVVGCDVCGLSRSCVCVGGWGGVSVCVCVWSARACLCVCVCVCVCERDREREREE